MNKVITLLILFTPSICLNASQKRISGILGQLNPFSTKQTNKTAREQIEAIIEKIYGQNILSINFITRKSLIELRGALESFDDQYEAYKILVDARPRGSLIGAIYNTQPGGTDFILWILEKKIPSNELRHKIIDQLYPDLLRERDLPLIKELVEKYNYKLKAPTFELRNKNLQDYINTTIKQQQLVATKALSQTQPRLMQRALHSVQNFWNSVASWWNNK